MEIQFGERVGQGGWLIEPKLFRPEAYPACASSRLWEFIYEGFICTTTQQLWNISILKETSIFLRSLSTGIILPLFVKQFGWNLWVFCHLSGSCLSPVLFVISQKAALKKHSSCLHPLLTIFKFRQIHFSVWINTFNNSTSPVCAQIYLKKNRVLDIWNTPSLYLRYLFPRI